MSTPSNSPRHHRNNARRNLRKFKRGFTPISLTPTGYQAGSTIYPDPEYRPYLESWRNNLAGMSHGHNLLFVASEDSLIIYEPQNPTQSLSGPSASLRLDPSEPDLLGDLGAHGHSSAHAVNNLLVSYLGDQEIVICAHDDGDVTAFYVETIYNDLLQSKNQFQTGLPLLSTRPFLHHNLTRSAWGIAVHTRARLIAVSCNDHTITVFAPALRSDSEADPSVRRPSNRENALLAASLLSDHDIDDSMEEEDDDMQSDSNGPDAEDEMQGFEDDENEDQEEDIEEETEGEDDEYEPSGSERHDSTGWRFLDRTDTPGKVQQEFRNRTRDVKVQLLDGHQHNIPSVAFCNSAEDPDGRFLISTDIIGAVILWNVHWGTVWRVLEPTEPDTTGFDTRRSGWSSIWLDIRAFTHADSREAAWGHDESVLRSRDGTFAVNVSEMRNHVSDRGMWPATSTAPRHQNSTPSPQSDPVQNDDGVGDTNPPASSSVSETTDNTGVMDADSDLDSEDGGIPLSAATSSDEQLAIPDTGGLPSASMTAQVEEMLNLMQASTPNPPRPFHSEAIEGISAHEYHLAYWPCLTLTCQDFFLSNAPKIPEPAAPLLLANPQSLTLYQDVKFHGRGRHATERPLIFLDDPLWQQMTPQMSAALQNHDRMNMHVQISELGVVLLGSPKGRVAVLTLHRQDSNPWCATSSKPLYSFRLDWLLPLNSQENQGQRPHQQLIGLTAAPVQGYENHAGFRPWRVFLIFREHSVLTYQIGKFDVDDCDKGQESRRSFRRV